LSAKDDRKMAMKKEPKILLSAASLHITTIKKNLIQLPTFQTTFRTNIYTQDLSYGKINENSFISFALKCCFIESFRTVGPLYWLQLNHQAVPHSMAEIQGHSLSQPADSIILKHATNITIQ
jgi:hypothetical protein